MYLLIVKGKHLRCPAFNKFRTKEICLLTFDKFRTKEIC